MNHFYRLLLVLFTPVCAFGQPKAAIEFRETKHDFGLIQEDAGAVTHSFLFENKGNAPLVIQHVEAACGCTTPGWSSDTISPGEMGYVKAQYNPYNRPGVFNKTLTVKTNGEPATTTLHIAGMVKPRPKTAADKYPTRLGALRVKYSGLHMGNVKENAVATKQFDVYNDSHESIRFSENVEVPDHISIRFLPGTLAPGEEGLIEVEYDAAAVNDLGFRTDDIAIETSEPDEHRTKKLRVVAVIEPYFPPMTPEQLAQAPRIKFDRTEHDFGSMPGSDTVSAAVTISNVGKKALHIRQVKPNCACIFTKLEKEKLKPGETTRMLISFDSTKRYGNQVKTVSVFSNDPREPIKVMTVKGRVN